MIYDLKHPIAYKKNVDTGIETECKGIQFRRPKGREASKVFGLLAALIPFAKDGTMPASLADNVIDFVVVFGSIVGDGDFPMEGVANQLDSADILVLAGEIVENFT